LGVFNFYQGPLAQLVEQWTFNPLVTGSNPVRPTTRLRRGNSKHQTPITKAPRLFPVLTLAVSKRLNKMRLFLVILAIFVINLVFGYWRANTKKFSWQWILAIHVPVPIAIGLRFLFLGWDWMMIPVFVLVFFAGQFAGGQLRHSLVKSYHERLSSNLLVDMVSIIRRKWGPDITDMDE
jgi:hypothetical protein